MTGAAVACLFLVLGFALFGKNLLNVWCIVIGVALYSRFKGETFATNINTAFFGVALAPIFSEILFSTSLTSAVSLPLAVVTSLAIGFVLAPAAAQLFKAHMGFTLYNMGFTAGLVGTLVVALYKSYGFVPGPGLHLDDRQQRPARYVPVRPLRVDDRRRVLVRPERSRPG